MNSFRYLYPKSSGWFISDILCEALQQRISLRGYSHGTRYPLVEYNRESKSLISKLLERRESIFTTTPNLICVLFEHRAATRSFFKSIANSTVPNNILCFTPYSGDRSGTYLTDADMKAAIVQHMRKELSCKVELKSVISFARNRVGTVDQVYGLLKQMSAERDISSQEDIIERLASTYEADTVRELITCIFSDNAARYFRDIDVLLSTDNFKRALYTANKMIISMIFREDDNVAHYYQKLYNVGSNSLSKDRLLSLYGKTRRVIRKIESCSNVTNSYCRDMLMLEIGE